MSVRRAQKLLGEVQVVMCTAAKAEWQGLLTPTGSRALLPGRVVSELEGGFGAPVCSAHTKDCKRRLLLTHPDQCQAGGVHLLPDSLDKH